MPNVFDQFDSADQEKPPPASGNVFDQFDKPAEGSGLISNLGAGFNRDIAQMLGAPVDLATGALNLGTRGINAVAGTTIPEIQQPFGGSESIKRGLGLVGLNPEDVKAETGGEKLVRNIGENVGSFVFPAIGAEATLARAGEALSPVGRAILEGLRGSSVQPTTAGATAANLGKNALFGVGAGAGQTAAEAVAPNNSTASFIGSLAGGLGVGAGEAAFRYAASRPSLATRAADQLTKVNDIAPPYEGASPGQYFTDRLDHLKAAENTVVEAAQAHANEIMPPPGPTTEQIGATARTSIIGNYAPAVALAERGDALAQQKLAQTAEGIGGNLQATDADTVRQQYGDQHRQFVQEGKDARAKEETRLWNAARQNGDLVFDHQPTVAAKEKAVGSINPAGGDRLTSAESSLYDTIGQWTGPQDFDTIKAMRSNIGDAADTAFRSGDRRAGSRLLTVRNGLDQSIDGAIDSRVAQERAAVQAGTLDPTQTFEAALIRDRDLWEATGSSSERPGAGVAGAGQGATAAQPIGEGAIPRGIGAEGAAPEGRAAVIGDQGMAGAAGSTVERYAAARAFTRETHQIFDQKPAGSVIARGPYGGRPEDRLPSSQVPGKFANSSVQQVENARNYEAAVGGRPEAIAALQDYLAFDLKNSAWNADTGRLNGTAFQRWMRGHDGLMTIYPELKEQFGNLANAQRALDEVQTARAALDRQLSAALGDSNATVMGQYFKRGPVGADAMDRYFRNTGDSAAARQAMADHITNDFLARVVANGEIRSPLAFRAWRTANDAALSRMPELAGKFDDLARAKQAVADAVDNRAQKIEDYENSAARFWLKTEPTTAVTNALSKRAGNEPAQNMRDLMAMTVDDAAAQAAIKRSVLEWTVEKGISGGDMTSLIADKRDALKEVFDAREMKRLDALADTLRKQNKSPTVMGSILRRGIRVAGYLGGHSVGGIWGGMAGYEVARDLTHGVAAATRGKEVSNLMLNAIRDPDQFRLLMRNATPANIEPLTRQLARRAGQSIIAGGLGAQ